MIELMILYVLQKRELTMYAVLKHIKDIFASYANPSFGAIKPALVRLENANFIRSRRLMSDGGKQSAFYSITTEGTEELKKLILEKTSDNPQQFLSTAKIKISCASFLAKDERNELFSHLKMRAEEHKFTAENILSNEYINVDFYQKIMLDNTICDYKNFISTLEGLEKDNAR